MRITLRKVLAAAVAVGTIATLSGAAVADDVELDATNVTKAPGETVVADVYLIAESNGQDATGCNATPTDKVTVTFTSSNTTVADAPADVMLEGCGTANKKQITVTVKAGALDDTHTFIAVSTATGGYVETGTSRNGTPFVRPSTNATAGESFKITVDVPTASTTTSTTTDPCAAVTDPAAPVISSDPATANGSNGWFTTGPTVSATSATEGATITYSTNGTDFSATAPTLSQGTTTVTAKATSATCDKTSTSSREFKVDSVAPSVDITSPAGPTTLASSVTVSGTQSDATSGVAGVTVAGTAATLGTGTFSRSNVTLACGTNTIEAIATDNAGNTGSDTLELYRVCFTGAFQQPLDGNGVLNKAKLGRVVPVKIVITANDGSTSPEAVYLGTRTVPCVTGATTDDVEAYAAGSSNGGNVFRLSDGAWIYNLDTSKLPNAAVGQCYQLDIYAAGTVNTATGLASGGVAVSNGIVRIQLTK